MRSENIWELWCHALSELAWSKAKLNYFLIKSQDTFLKSKQSFISFRIDLRQSRTEEKFQVFYNIFEEIGKFNRNSCSGNLR